MTKLWMPPNSPCIRCNGAIVTAPDKMVCDKCGQVWGLGPDGCWEAEMEDTKDLNGGSPFRYIPGRGWVARVEQTITIPAEHLSEFMKMLDAASGEIVNSYSQNKNEQDEER